MIYKGFFFLGVLIGCYCWARIGKKYEEYLQKLQVFAMFVIVLTVP